MPGYKDARTPVWTHITTCKCSVHATREDCVRSGRRRPQERTRPAPFRRLSLTARQCQAPRLEPHTGLKPPAPRGPTSTRQGCRHRDHPPSTRPCPSSGCVAARYLSGGACGLCVRDVTLSGQSPGRLPTSPHRTHVPFVILDYGSRTFDSNPACSELIHFGLVDTIRGAISSTVYPFLRIRYSVY